MKIMKLYTYLLSAAVLATACNSKAPSTDATVTPAPDTGQVMIQPELPPADTQQVNTTPPATSKESTTPSKKTAAAASSAGQSTAGTAGAGTTDAPASAGTGNTETEKKGWSKAAKGAVIGGVTGAAAGAVINKKNRGAGAVIGGVTGAGAGAIIGNEMDKKDGRRQ